ncbi:polyamine-modulated factor 1-binding protein 1 isoform X2 [Xenopus laevis]|uniref:Polyamine-modulated factor 1-binding protein 1 isoform X2 n=1 Tax=Xenopus laevis TaxID=8355 RepID=A0A8J0VHS3_XENLA|nr:polyamine-modulated factor 1-binding protein 1 isoform X2 [Xenopus laevis]
MDFGDDRKTQFEAKDHKISVLQDDLRNVINDGEALLDKAQEQTIYQLQAEKYNLKSELNTETAEVEHLQSELDMFEKLYGQAKRQLDEKESKFQKIIAQQKQYIEHLEDELRISGENQERSKKEILKLEQVIIEQRKEMKQLQHLYQDTLEKNGRLEAKIETHMITAQSEQDVFLNEISGKEEIIHQLKMQEIDHEQKLSKVDKQIQHQNVLFQELRGKYDDLVGYAKGREELVQSLIKQLQDANAAGEEAKIEVNDCGETIRHLHLELASLQTAEDSARKTVIVKEHIRSELYEECEKMKCIVGEMQFKLSTGDVKINELNLEVGILKSELEKKTRGMETLDAQIQKQQATLNRASDRLKETKKAAANKIHDKEMKCEALQKELLKAQNQYSACYDELLHRENLLHKFKEENIHLTDQIKQKSQDVSKMSEEKKKVELKLAVVIEKHKTAQQEVNNKDQNILQHKTDLKTAQEKYLGSQEELRLQEEEVSRLQQKMKCLQTEACELWEKCNEQEDQLNQVEKAKQHMSHEQEILLGKLHNNMTVIEKLQKDLDLAKHLHTTDLERWTLQTSLLQKELTSGNQAHHEDLQKIQECKDKISSLQVNLENADLLHKEANKKIETGEESIEKKNEEIQHLQLQVKDLQRKLKEMCNQAKANESAVELHKNKCQLYYDNIKAMEREVETLQEQVTESATEIANKKETIQSLEAEVLILQHQYKEKSDQVETFEGLIDQLTGELHSSKDNVKLNKEQCQQYEQLAKTMKDKVQCLQKQISDNEDCVNQLTSELTAYKSSHSHSDEEYNAKVLLLQTSRNEIEVLQAQLKEKASEIEDYQREIEEKKAERADVLARQNKYSLEMEELEKTLQSLHRDIMASEQEHKADLVRINTELTDARSICSQKDQAISKRDDLLRKSEADLLQAREEIKEKVAELEHLDSVVKKLEESIQDAERKAREWENENNELEAEVKKLQGELQDVHKLYEETARELVSQAEKLLYLETSSKATQEQLSKQIAETVRQEQNSRKCQTDLKTLTECFTVSDEENRGYKEMLDKLKVELIALKAEHQHTVQETLPLQQANHKLKTELASVKDHARNLELQAESYEELVKVLREEQNQEQLCYQEEKKHIEMLKRQILGLESKVEKQRLNKQKDTQVMKEQQRRLEEIEEELCQTQEKYNGVQNELLEVEARSKMLHFNLMAAEKQINHHTEQVLMQEESVLELAGKLSQAHKLNQETIKDLGNREEQLETYKSQCKKLKEKLTLTSKEVLILQDVLKTTEQKYSESEKKLEAQCQALEAAKTDNSRLHQESEFVAANVNHWIKEQKLANENLGIKIKEQNQLLAHLTAERDHFQKLQEALSMEILKLRSESEEIKRENESLTASCAEQQALLLKLQSDLDTQNYISHDQTSLLEEKLAATKDIHTKLKANIKSIDFLNQKLNELSQENENLQKKLEDETLRCRQYELLLQTSNQTVANLFAQLQNKQEQKEIFKHCPSVTSLFGKDDKASCLSPLLPNEAQNIHQMEGTKDSEGSSYWIKCVEELSTQLQENTDYWTEKMNTLTAEIQQKCVTSPQ